MTTLALFVGIDQIRASEAHRDRPRMVGDVYDDPFVSSLHCPIARTLRAHCARTYGDRLVEVEVSAPRAVVTIENPGSGPQFVELIYTLPDNAMHIMGGFDCNYESVPEFLVLKLERTGETDKHPTWSC